MNIKIVLQEEYQGYGSGKEIIVREPKYKQMYKEGVKMRVIAPERIKAGTSKARYVFEKPAKPAKPADEEE